MNIEELQARGAIFFERIDEGLRKYRDEVLKMSEEETFAFFRKKCYSMAKKTVLQTFIISALRRRRRRR